MLLVEQVVTPGPRWDKHGREGAGRGADPQLPNKEEVTGFWDNLPGFNYNRHGNMETQDIVICASTDKEEVGSCQYRSLSPSFGYK